MGKEGAGQDAVLVLLSWAPQVYLPCCSDGKESTCDSGDLGSIPGSGRSPGEENGNPLQYSCLGNPMNRGVLPSDGFACDKKSFDVHGRIIDWELFGIENEKVNGTFGWHRAVSEYGRDGKLFAERFYDKSGRLIEKED